MSVIGIAKNIWNFLKGLFSSNLELISKIGSINDSTINITNGNLYQTTVVNKFNNQESVDAFANQMINFLQKKCLIDINSDKFKYYVGQSIILLRLNDSQTKRYILKELLFKKFSGDDLYVDDSDTPLTIALEAMKSLSDTTIRRLCSYRFVTNVIPSLSGSDNMDNIPRIWQYIDKSGYLSATDIYNLRRCGIIYDMGTKVYYINEGVKYKDIMSNLPYFHELDNPLLMSNAFTPAGLILTDIIVVFTTSYYSIFCE